MSAILCIVGWVTGVAALWFLVWRISRNWQSLGAGLARALFRSFVVAFAFAPTAIVAGYFGFLYPAAAALVGYAVAGRWNDPQLRQDRQTALFGFILFWAVGFLFAAFRFLWLYDRRKAQLSSAPRPIE